jgi:hypothetical protein
MPSVKLIGSPKRPLLRFTETLPPSDHAILPTPTVRNYPCNDVASKIGGSES